MVEGADSGIRVPFNVPGSQPTVDGSVNAASPAITMDDSTHVAHLKVEGGTDGGIAATDATNLVIEDSVIDDTGVAGGAPGVDLDLTAGGPNDVSAKIIGNRIARNDEGVDIDATGPGGAGSSFAMEISGTFVNNSDDAIEVEADTYGSVQSELRDLSLRQNQNGVDMDIASAAGDATIIAQNVVANNNTDDGFDPIEVTANGAGADTLLRMDNVSASGNQDYGIDDALA